MQIRTLLAILAITTATSLYAGTQQINTANTHNAENTRQHEKFRSAVLHIHASIGQQWRIPRMINGKTSATLQLQLNRDGSLHTAAISKSSGNPAFDDSILKATRHATPFDIVKNMDDTTFKQHMKMIKIQFHTGHVK
ncbi:TonB family protein [Marinobacterium marinum]|uniref:TonB C-terminal domain-containing protein n=1 Tax=Marinobacterium marinum TaxID=2756129 RepID=A0A7W2AC42_9GAMM|nr:TonB family protein [Marinobacterium marinum]MBA4502740.1 TonB C-terminal domain-containing protein [Marinobacterium marinum]